MQNRKPDTQVRQCFHWAEAARNITNMLEEAEKLNYSAFQHMCQKALSQNSRSSSLPPDWSPMVGQPYSFLLGQKCKYLKKARRQLSAEHWVTYKKVAAKLIHEIRDMHRLYWNSTCTVAARSGSIYRILKSIQNRDTNTKDFHLTLIGISADPTEKEEVNAFARTYSWPMDESRLPLDFGVNNDQCMCQPF